MSDTPKTDAATIQVPVAELPSGEGITHPMVPAFVSRDMERELSVANNWVAHHQNHVDDLIKENAALRDGIALILKWAELGLVDYLPEFTREAFTNDCEKLEQLLRDAKGAE